MPTQRISLSSSMFEGRIKRYDTYHSQSNRTSRRESTAHTPTHRSVQPQEIVPSRPVVADPRVAARIKIPADRRTTNVETRVESLPVVNGKQTVHQWLAMHAVAHSPALSSAILADQFIDVASVKSHKRGLSKLQKLMYVFGTTVFLIATVVSVQTFLTNKQTKQQLGVLGEQVMTTDENGVEMGTGDEPSEVVPSAAAISSYTVSPDAPRYLRIPSLQVVSRIKTVGVTKEGAVDAPGNIHDAGWYNGSAKPGSTEGASLLVGHVSGWTASGVFKKIDKLQPGMRFEVEKGSGEKITYEVTRSEKLPVEAVNMAAILSTEVAGEHDIKLITCAGKYDKASDRYLDRFIVYAKQLK